MVWKKSAIQRIINLLFSKDEDNKQLAFELIKGQGDASPFVSALCFLKTVEQGHPKLVNNINTLLENYGDAILQSEYEHSLQIITELWSLNKEKFLEALANFNSRSAIFDQYIHINPEYSYIYHDIGQQLISKFRLRSIGNAYLLKTVELNPNSGDAHFQYAYHLPENKKHADKIIYHYHRCLELGTDFVWVYHNLGRSYSILKNDIPKAKELLEEGLRKYPKTVDTMIELAFIIEEDHPDEARQWLEQAVQLNPDKHLAHNNLSYLLWLRFNAFNSAKKHIQLALHLAPKRGLYWHTLAEIEYYGFSNSSNAIKALEKALLVDPNYTAAKEMLKFIQLKEG